MRSAAVRFVFMAMLAGHTPAAAASELDFLLGNPSDREPAPAAAEDPSPPEAREPADGTTGAEEADLQTIPVQPVRAVQETGPVPRGASRTIEEIVVTAQKTEQSLRDVPMSVSAIGGEQIRESAITEAQELVQYTPNVKFQSGANNIPSISIRGFGSPPLGRNLEPSVGLSIDDVFYGRSTFTNDAVFDVKRLEVLRGPQGTLFGKNTVAGVLSFTTAEPALEPEGYATLALASFDERRAEGGFGFPLFDDELAARLAFRARDRVNGIYNTTLDREGTASDITGRIKLRWLISDALTADVGYFTSSSKAQGVGFQLERATDRSLERFRRYDPETETDPFDGRQSLSQEQFSNRRTQGLSLKLEQSVGTFAFMDDLALTLIGAQATSEAPYLIDTDFSPIPSQSLGSDGPELYKQQSLELRATATTPAPFGWVGSLDWIVGAFAIRTRADVTQFSIFNRNSLIDLLLGGAGPVGQVPTLPAPIVDRLQQLGLPTDISDLPNAPALFGPNEDQEYILNALHTRADSLALFTQATWNLGDRLSLILGLRYGREKGEGEQSSQCTPEAGTCFGGPVFAGQQDFMSSGARDESELSPKLALTFDLSDQVTLFGNVTRGFKSGGFSGPLLAPRNLQYRPERALSTEVGIKSRLFDRSLMLNATAYRVEFEDLQVQLFDGVNISTLNAASAVSQGLEVDFQWLPPLEFLTIAGSFGLTDVAYGHFPCGPAVAGDTDSLPECESDDGSSAPERPNPRANGGTQDLSGRVTPFTPRLTGSFTPSVKLPLFPRLGIGALIGVDVLYQGEQYLDADLDPQTFQRATTKINARFGVKPVDGPWALIFNAKNLTGEQERVLVLDQQQYVGNYVTIPLPDEPVYSLDLRYTIQP